jgi:hypothetical protein
MPHPNIWQCFADFINSIPLSEEAKACRCKGDCPCHIFMQLAGVPCPTDCPNFGNHFDGCHRCDC